MTTTATRYSTLELLLLACAKYGFGTSYDLLNKAGLTLGGTSSALKRLQKAKLLTSKPGMRGSQRFTITAEGERELKRGWLSMAKDRPAVSPEEALRVLYLGWLFDDFDLGIQHAIWIAHQLRVRAEQQRTTFDDMMRQIIPSGHKKIQPSSDSLLSPYKLIKLRRDAEIAMVEADLIESAMKKLHEFPPACEFLEESKKSHSSESTD